MVVNCCCLLNKASPVLIGLEAEVGAAGKLGIFEAGSKLTEFRRVYNSRCQLYACNIQQILCFRLLEILRYRLKYTQCRRCKGPQVL